MAVDTVQFIRAPRPVTRALTAIAVVPWAKFDPCDGHKIEKEITKRTEPWNLGTVAKHTLIIICHSTSKSPPILDRNLPASCEYQQLAHFRNLQKCVHPAKKGTKKYCIAAGLKSQKGD